ncbi:DUF2332 domain-containing protein [Microlunatus speluncae]|uniref:DUF2332 domain-containing protein n=1 Tax=Microlunatus speluncae TaxID=2594267 RepID=UPI0012663586|nr:DUF2332 domain-containing protein [Microlunatus speluncae]
MEIFGPIQDVYRDFARYASATSPCFDEWALGVATDGEVLDWLAELPEPKRQPNLVFAAARWHGLKAPAPYAELRAALLNDDGPIRATILERATQTNEVGRLATLVPAFAAISTERPVALFEVGASAGLCLFPDRWSYRWETAGGPVTLGDSPRVLSATVTGPAALPITVPRVTWRGGVDLNPLDLSGDDAANWLLTLVWPEHDHRRQRLKEAIDVARQEPPDIVRGDLLVELPAAVERALRETPDDTPLIVFHSAVIVYLDDDGRARFQGLMQKLIKNPRVHWVSNEGRSVLPEVTVTGPDAPAGRFVLGVDGRAVGHTEGHGAALHWWPTP